MTGWLIVLVLAGLIAVQTPRVQTRLADRVKSLVDEKTGGTLDFSSVYVTPSGTVILKDVLLIDDNPYREDRFERGWPAVDTILYAGNISAAFTLKGIISDKGIALRRVKLDDAVFNYVTEPDSLNPNNLTRILGGKKQKEKKNNGTFSVRRVEVNNLRTTIRSFKQKPVSKEHGINWAFMDVTARSIRGRNVVSSGGILSGIIDKAVLSEKSGLELSASGKVKVGMGKTTVDNLHLWDEFSDIRATRYSMTYESGRSFRHYVSEVLMHGDFEQSTVSFETLKYFTGSSRENSTVIDLRKGTVDGYVNDLSVKGLDCTDLTSGTMIMGDVSLVGLPNIRNTIFKIRLTGSSLTTKGIGILAGNFIKGSKMDISGIAPGYRLHYVGTATGPLNKFLVKGDISSDIGNASADLDLRNIIDSLRPVEISGTLKTDDLDLGRAMGIKALGPCTMRAGARATLTKGAPSMIVDSLFVDRLNALEYDYSGIAAVGKFSGKAFDGKVICNDPNLNFLFQGIFNLSKKTNNALYKFYANLGYADLEAIHLDRRGGKSKAAGQISANFMRVTEGDIIGDIDVAGLNLENDLGKHDIGNIHIASHSNADIHRIQFKSSFADAGYIGKKAFTSMIRDIQKVTTRRDLPALYTDRSEEWDDADYDLDCEFHDSRDFLSFLAPQMYIADSTAISLRVNRSGFLQGNVTSPRVAFKGNYLKGLDIMLDNLDNSINCTLTSDEVKAGGIALSNTALTAYAAENAFSLGLHFDGRNSSDDGGEIYLNGDIERDASDTLTVRAQPLSSYIRFDDQNWDIKPSEIVWRAGDIKVRDFRISSDDQLLTVDGGVSGSTASTLRINLKNIALDILGNLSARDYGLGGRLTGYALLKSPTHGNPALWVNIGVDSLLLGEEPVGDLKLASTWDEEVGKMSIYLRNITADGDAVNVKGAYLPDTRTVSAQAKFNSFGLGALSPFVRNTFSELGGKIDGNLDITGPMDNLNIHGDNLNLDNAKLRVAFTNVPYTLNGPFHVDSTGVYLDNIYVRDRLDGTGLLSGKVNFDHLRNPEVSADLKIDRMEVMNNSEEESRSIYGNIFASGDIAVVGPLGSLSVDVNATTVKDGRIHIPLTGFSSAKVSDLLTFREPERYEDPYEVMQRVLATKAHRRSSLIAKARITATPELEALLELDKESGNAFSGRGAGVITINLEPSKGVFNLGGDYNISSGDVHFSAMSLVNKDFQIQNGSSVKFNGEIMDTELDLNARYSLKTSLSTLVADTTSVSARRTVNCGIAISDKLRNPQLAFSIDVPDLDPTTKSLVESALNTSDKVQKQFIALLITGGFIPSEQSGVVYNTSNMLLSNISDIMSGQLNNILQKLDIPLDLGLNYQQNERGTDIFDVAVSTQLFNNRVTVNGNIANRQYSTTSNNDVVGDLDIEVKLDKSGQVRLNLFSHSADKYTSYLDNTQRNGVGITYQREFKKFRDFFKTLFMSKKKREEWNLQQATRKEEQVTITIDNE